MLTSLKGSFRLQYEALQYEALQDKLLLAWEKDFAPRYQALQSSEQRLILFAAVVLPLVILIFGIVVPVADKNSRLQHDIVTLSSNLEEAKHLAILIAAQPQGAGSGGNNNQMLTIVDKLARDTGVRSFMTRLRPQQIMGSKNRLQAQIKAAPYAKVVGFLSALAKHNLPIESIKIQAFSPGLVHVQAVIGG